ncbi:arsenite efflux transporter metallochaperone ArsD [Hohaiivirga grylli]
MKIQVYDPALCCSTGACGPNPDEALIVFASDIDWAKQQGITIERYNLAQQPVEFANNPTVKAFLERSGADSLPLVLIDGEIAMAGRYPSRAELASWAKIKIDETSSNGSSSCCGNSNNSQCC